MAPPRCSSGSRSCPGAVPALERALARDLDGRVRRRAADAIRRLQRGRDGDEELGKLRDDLDKAREEIRALRDRLERLEKLSLAASGLPGNAVRPPASRGC